jgi:hypothetical protein
MPELFNPKTHQPMQSLNDVFGSERAAPHAIFTASRIENADANPEHRRTDLAMECPRCLAQGTPGVRLFAKAKVGYFCTANHVWKDYDELMSLNPTKLAFVGQAARQEGWEKFTLEMPGSVLQDLQRKFGERLAATLRAVIEMLATTKFLMVPEENLQKLTEYLGVELPNAATLMGAVFSMKTTNATLKEENTNLRDRGTATSGPVTATTLFVELGRFHQKIVERAKEQNWSAEELVRYCVETTIEAGWA